MRRNKKGFTLLELIIVIFVIAIISTIVIVSLSGSRQKGRDAKRISDVTQIQIALETYYQLENSYPGQLIPGQPLIGSSTGVVFLSQIPKNITSSNDDCLSDEYAYSYYDDSGKYGISFCLESNIEGYSSGQKCATTEGILNRKCDPCAGQKIAQDIENNSYSLVFIGEQCWFAENLKTTKYNDGNNIPNITDPAEWNLLSNPAYVWYGNDINNKDIYGALYNWYAVDTEKLCPSGWSVPSNDDWTNLINYIVAETDAISSTAARWLKSCRYTSGANSTTYCSECESTEPCPTSSHPRWSYYNNHYGINAYDFSVLPAGYRLADGSFNALGGIARLWSSSEDGVNARYSLFFADHSEVYQYSQNLISGHSVRCLKDN